MSERIHISKRVRFEVFKRDGFCCQYCGAHPPAVVLEVDHITPVVEGGENDMDNLVTACFACNRGKAANLLTDVPQSLQDKAAEVLERDDQIRGYQRVMAEKRERLDEQAEIVDEVFERFNPGYCLTERSLVSVRNFIDKLGLDSVIDAMELAYTKHAISESKRFRYFCGICWNRIRGGDQQ